MEGHHYSVAGKKYNNYYEALRYGHEINSFVEYVIPQWHIEEMCSVNVKDIMDTDPFYFMREKIKWIMQNYQTHRLFYTGGTDSHTILRLAEELGVKFTHSMTALSSVRNDSFVDEEYIPGVNYLKTSSAVINKEIFRPTEQHYEDLWSNTNNFFKQRGAFFSFRPTFTDIILQNREKTEAYISGHFKPKIFYNKGHYYLVALSCHDEYMGLPNEISFFGDGIIPELAVQQAYRSLNFFKKHTSDVKSLDTQSLSNNLILKYNNALGRKPPLTKTIGIGKILGKSGVLNEKMHRSMKEIFNIGRSDIIDNWNKVRLELLDMLEHIPYGIETPTSKMIIDDWQDEHKNIKRVCRIAFALRMDQDRLRVASIEDAIES